MSAASRIGLVATLGALALAQLALTAAGVGGWPCPLRMATGIPCPGCGLTRATLALAAGDWSAAMALHPLAPAVLVACVAGCAFLLAPDALRARFARAVPRRIRGIALGLALAAVLLTWIARLPAAMG